LNNRGQRPIFPYAIAGIKEMDLKVQELQKENAALRQRLEALEKKGTP